MFRLQFGLAAALLVLLSTSEAFAPVRRKSLSPKPWRQQHQRRVPRAVNPLPDWTSQALVTAEATAEWRQYVPLVTIGFVLLDIVAGLATGNSVALALIGNLQAQTEAALGDAVKGPDDAESSAARIDTDKVSDEAMRLAEEAMAAVDRQPKRGSAAELKKRIDRQLER